MWQRSFAKIRSREGQGLVEYALILMLVAIAAYLALQGLGVNVTGAYTKTSGTLKGGSSSSSSSNSNSSNSNSSNSNSSNSNSNNSNSNSNSNNSNSHGDH
jgi:Flp pilus assembly pilin Flp